MGIVGLRPRSRRRRRLAIPLPWTPVPITLQPMLVILAGMFLGPVAGAASMALYLAAGAAVFRLHTDGAPGVARFFGPLAAI
jgi:biotin transport system substrate-specific component